MLNAKAISGLLSQNRDDRLCKRWYLMTPNGTILAYSQPTDINDLRKQAALTALSWQDHARQAVEASYSDEFARQQREATQHDALHFLSIESEQSNILVQKLQKTLVLVLEGGVPPRRSSFERKITAEADDGSPLQPFQSDESADTNSNHNIGTSISSHAESNTSSVAGSVVQIQRKKLDALANAITAEFERSGFKMPEEGNTAYF